MLYEIVHKMWSIIRDVLKETKLNRLNYSTDDNSYMMQLGYHKDPGFRDTDYILSSH